MDSIASDANVPVPESDGGARLKEAHLLDVGNLVEIAQWVLAAMASGVIGNAAYDVLNRIKRQRGSSRVRELETKVLELLDAKAEGPDSQGLRERVTKLFEEFR